jgi:hypothetical protein
MCFVFQFHDVVQVVMNVFFGVIFCQNVKNNLMLGPLERFF